MNDQQKHYDAEYSSGRYAGMYEELPEWAAAMNRWHMDFTIALLGLDPAKGKILDLGSGRGHYLDAWWARGYEVHGREISQVAIDAYHTPRWLDQGDATDLSSYKDDEFQLVFSAAFLEHVTDQQVLRMVKDAMRIAPYSAHYIAHSKGGDEGHINIKTPQQWFDFLVKLCPTTFVVPNLYCPVQPAFLLVRKVTPAMGHFIANYGGTK